ncbi:MAG: isoprenylcysteine carboxylmethyltransferase family protein [Acidobacteria bacterium]|nr:MAG: isoprenylcysteine carboxylmethyltransferase family protein [Acidobacteriota bacterium]
MTRRARRVLWAFGAGVTCHAAFVAGVAAMAVGLFTGMRSGLGRLHGLGTLVADGALIAQFPLLHSWLLGSAGRARLAALLPDEFGADLVPTVFATVSSLQMLAAFELWSPSGVVLWRVTGSAFWIACGVFAAGWLLLARSMVDAGLGLQSGAAGWLAVLRGRRVAYPAMPTRGTFRHVRQPMYLAYAVLLWAGPVLTLDKLALACAWTAYCVLGPLHKEARSRRRWGARWEAYRRAVPYMLPRLRPRRT